MVRCSENFWDCIPCCDFCIHAKHQDIAEGCGYCEDFQCFNADKEAGRWFEGE